MNRTLLVADDDKYFQRVVSRVFAGTPWLVEAVDDGITALERICRRAPDVLLLDLNMPRMGGRELLAHIRRTPRLATLPVILISGDGVPREAGGAGGLGADDYLPKPFDTGELVSKVEGAARRGSRKPGASTLTSLPGGPLIEEEAQRRIASGVPTAFICLDIDNFRIYNENYGCQNGDNVIKCVAGLLAEIKNDFETDEVFVGHIGGDNFVVMARPCRAGDMAQAIAVGFDEIAPGFYSETDRSRGGVISKDRAGFEREFPLMTLSIAIAVNEKKELRDFAAIVEKTGRISSYLKGMQNRFGSVYLKDRTPD